MPTSPPAVTAPGTRGDQGVTRAAVAVIVAVALAIAGATVAVAVAGTSATVGSVFYSGEGCAGLAQAAAATQRLRAQGFPCVPVFTGGTGVYNGQWTRSSCDPSGADTFPAVVNGKAISQLVGFSLGRLGAMYFLEAADSQRKANINYIVMLDPGGTSDFTAPSCDNSLRPSAAGLLSSWLASNADNRLLVIAGVATQERSSQSTPTWAGFNNVYLNGIPTSQRQHQVFVCDADKGTEPLSHNDTMAQYANLISTPFPGKCPGSSHQVDQPANPPNNPKPAPTPAPTATGGSGTPSSQGTANGQLQIGWSSAHPNWISMTLNGFTNGSYTYMCNFGSGGGQSFTVTVTADGETFDNGHTCYDAIAGDTVWVTIGNTRSNTLTVSAGADGSPGTGNSPGTGSGPPPTQPPPPPTKPSNPPSLQLAWSSSHPSWVILTISGLPDGSYPYTCNFGSGGDQSFTVTVTADPETYDNGHTCYDAIADDTVWVTIGNTQSNTLTVQGVSNPPTTAAPPPTNPPPPPSLYPETAGGVAHTWTNYNNAGGYPGPVIQGGQTVDISCAIPGFRVQDGNTWWYRIASPGWDNNYYVSADAFYNTPGQTSGSLHGTPFVDPAVPGC